jgi:tRNA (guanine37-N1)-methyltransferase
MRVGVVTLFPAMIEGALQYGVLARAMTTGQLDLVCANPREWATDKHRTVDDRPFGGGPGMVMKPGPLIAAISHLREQLPDAEVVYLSPQGDVFDQPLAEQWQTAGSLILVAGRYEGIDERVVEMAVDREISLGDYVLSGGEVAALAVIDAVTRLEPGVLGDPQSALQDSFGNEGLLDCPHYTRPEKYDECKVPAVLLSGNHVAIARWRRQQALERTRARRPELLDKADLSATDRQYLQYLEQRCGSLGSSSSE